MVVGAHVSGLAEDAVQRPEPAHAVRPTALFVDAPHGPPAAVDGEVLPVLVDPEAEAGRTELESHIIPHARSRAPAVFRYAPQLPPSCLGSGIEVGGGRSTPTRPSS